MNSPRIPPQQQLRQAVRIKMNMARMTMNMNTMMRSMCITTARMEMAMRLSIHKTTMTCWKRSVSTKLTKNKIEMMTLNSTWRLISL